MGACRQSQNLFWLIKTKDWKRFWHLIKHFDKITYDDTFMPLVCKIKGHVGYQPDPRNEPNEWACKRCHRFIKWNPRKEKLKKLKKVSNET